MVILINTFSVYPDTVHVSVAHTVYSTLARLRTTSRRGTLVFISRTFNAVPARISQARLDSVHAHENSKLKLNDGDSER